MVSSWKGGEQEVQDNQKGIILHTKIRLTIPNSLRKLSFCQLTKSLIRLTSYNNIPVNIHTNLRPAQKAQQSN
jgi:hypothetical protein